MGFCGGRVEKLNVLSTIAVLLWALSSTVAAQNPSNPPELTLLDPVPALLNGPKVTTNVNLLATKGRVVQGVGADAVTEMVIRISANSAGEKFTLTVINDEGLQSTSYQEDGGLGGLGSSTFTLSQVRAAAVNTTKGPMAFAIYAAPVDFPRSEGQDANSTSRSISLQAKAQDTGLTTTATVTILRAPVVLIHGLWGSSQSWSNFTPFITDPRFTIDTVDYSTTIGGQIKSYTPTYPSWAVGSLANAQANSLGFSYNAPTVLNQITGFINTFKNGTNAGGIPVASVQADIVAHSMGGDITRTLPLQTNFYSNNTYAFGSVHKVVTIATPHWGSPLAIDLLDSNNECVRGVLALSDSPSFTTVTFKSGKTVNGAVNDLQGDGFGGSLSTALQALQNPIKYPLPTALIQGLESQSQLDGLDSSSTAAFIRLLCFGDYLADNLTSSGWPTVLGQDSDSIVPALSAVAGLSDFTLVNGVIHSASSEELGFGPPAELDADSGVEATVTDLLNTNVTNATFVPLPQQ